MLRFILSVFGALFSSIVLGFLAIAAVSAVFFGSQDDTPDGGSAAVEQPSEDMTTGFFDQELPSHETLLKYTPPTISRIYSTEGRIIDEFARERRLFVPQEEIPDLIKHAFISAEDKNFYEHSGYDPRGIASAAVDAAKGNRLRGASTISQQVVKNFLLSSDRTIDRKIKELILSVRLENALEKEDILELYLNEIFLGQNSFGVAAAAQTYYNKSLDDLTAGEAAYLAALPKRPSTLHPVRQYEAAVGRRNFVLREMSENGYITDEVYRAEKELPLLSVQNNDYESFRLALPKRDYFTDEIRRQLSRNFGEEEFFGGGLAIRATQIPELQDTAATALRIGLTRYDREQGLWRASKSSLAEDLLGDEELWRPALRDVQTPRDIAGWVPAVVLRVGSTHAQIGIEGVEDDEDGHFIAPADVTWATRIDEDGTKGRKAQVAGDLLRAGEVVYVTALLDGEGEFDRWSLRQIPDVQGAFMAMDVNSGRVLAMQGGFSYDHSVFNRATQATRQPGSVFKPFVYAAALDSGYTPATIIVDAPIEIDQGNGDIWRPTNASKKFYGPTPLRTGIERSRNLMTIRLAQDVGLDVVAGYAERFGVYDQMNPYLANALGAEETTLFNLVGAYAMFANGGERVAPTLVDRVQDRWGRTVYKHDRRECVDCENANLVGGISPGIRTNRERVLDPVTAYQLTSMMQGVVERGTASSTISLPYPIAGKTGTTNDSKDAWFIGFSSNIVAGCYIGFDRPTTLGRGASGGALCGPVFNHFMAAAIEEFGAAEFSVPPGGRFINIDRYSGERLGPESEGEWVVAEYFRSGEEPVFGLGSMIDGGFAMGSNLPVFSRGEGFVETDDNLVTSTGAIKKIPKKATFGSLSSGGLY